MVVTEVNWGAWFKLEENGSVYYSILCQIGRGSSDLEIQWSEYFDKIIQDRNLSVEKLLNEIIYSYYEYCSHQVNQEIVARINSAIEEFNIKANNLSTP